MTCHRQMTLRRRASATLDLQQRIICLILAASTTLVPSQGISSLCFELLSNTSAIYMQEHPATKLAVVATQKGMIYLTTLPSVGSKQQMETQNVFLDLTNRVHFKGEMGLLSFAFHPDFITNGRFFVSYTCDSSKYLDCKVPLGCVPTADNKAGCPNVKASNFTTVVAEYRTGKEPLKQTSLIANEYCKVIAFARPFTNHHGGHIFFGKDKYLYLTSGDGGSQGDPYNLAQNVGSQYGKILRLNVDKVTKTTNYTIPSTNPFQKSGQNPLIYALGLRNPWRCDVDADGTLACGDVGGSIEEEVSIIKSKGNYGWRNYEGARYSGTGPKQGSPLYVGDFKYPALSYTHGSLGGLGCIIGGVFYRSSLNRCLKGKYLYADYSGAIWVASLSGTPSTTKVTFSCAQYTPLACPTPSGDGTDTEWGGVYSWSKDLSGNAYLLTSSGIFRVAELTKCAILCSAS